MEGGDDPAAPRRRSRRRSTTCSGRTWPSPTGARTSPRAALRRDDARPRAGPARRRHAARPGAGARAPRRSRRGRRPRARGVRPLASAGRRARRQERVLAQLPVVRARAAAGSRARPATGSAALGAACILARACKLALACISPYPLPSLPMLAKRVERAARRATGGSSSRSGTASACSSSATATSSSSRAATRSRSTATSPSSRSRSRRSCPTRCVLDGEIVIAHGGALDFEALQLRLHPAASRVKMLAERDAGLDRLLGPAVRSATASLRRDAVPRAARASSSRCSRTRTPPIHLTPATTDRARRGRLVPALRGRRARRRDGQAGARARTSRTSASCSR